MTLWDRSAKKIKKRPGKRASNNGSSKLASRPVRRTQDLGEFSDGLQVHFVPGPPGLRRSAPRGG